MDFSCDHDVTEIREGFHVCCKCGVVTGQNMQQIEWVAGVDDSRQRASNVAEEEWDYMGTTVRVKGIDKVHMGLSTSNRARIYNEGREFLRQLCVNLQTGAAVEEETLSIFHRVRDLYARWRCAKRVGVAITCVSLACQKLSVGISDATILRNPMVNQPSRVMNAQKKAVLISLHKRHGELIQQPDASEFCVNICNRMGFPPELRLMVRAETRRISQLEHLNARSPSMVVAVSVLYLLEKNEYVANINKLCRAIEVTRPTLIKWYADATQRDMPASRIIIQNMDTRTGRI